MRGAALHTSSQRPKNWFPPAESTGNASGVSKKTVTKTKRADSKVLIDDHDSDYITSDEDADERNGGGKMFPLLKIITKPCRRKKPSPGEERKKLVRCIGSKGCHQIWRWKRDKDRILKHAIDCSYISSLEGGRYVEQALRERAKKHEDIIDDIRQKFGAGSTSKESKRLRSESPDPSLEQQGVKRIKLSTAKPLAKDKPGNDMFRKFRSEGKEILHEKANDALLKFIICCGIPPNVLTTRQFKNFVAVLNGLYNPPSRTTFEDKLVPTYAATMRIARLEYLKTCSDLQISFDGGKLKKKGFYSIHVTTLDRTSYCLELDDGSRLSHTGEYVCELLCRVSPTVLVIVHKWLTSTVRWQHVNQIGPYRVTGVCSDDAGNTAKGWRLFCTKFIHVFNMADSCHGISNGIKDICALVPFKRVCVVIVSTY